MAGRARFRGNVSAGCSGWRVRAAQADRADALVAVAEDYPASSAGGGGPPVEIVVHVDLQCLTGAATTGGPGAIVRGGDFQNAIYAGELYVRGDYAPNTRLGNIGFRCGR
jgi:hypothetical protein